MNNLFEKIPQMTLEQIAADEAAIAAIRERNLTKQRAEEAAAEKIADASSIENRGGKKINEGFEWDGPGEYR